MAQPSRQPLATHDQRAVYRLTLGFGAMGDFRDPRLEYRRLFAETLGTFLLVLAAAGGGLLHAKGQIGLSAAVVAPGLTVMAVILFMGAVSGAHLNPVVSMAFALRGDFEWRRVPGYVGAQLAGAALACLFLLAVFGNIEHLGATLPGAGLPGMAGVPDGDRAHRRPGERHPRDRLEAQNVGLFGAFGVGGYIALAGLWAAPVSGTSMNPARSFGPALASGDWTAFWAYVAGPADRRRDRPGLRVGPTWTRRGRHRPDGGIWDPRAWRTPAIREWSERWRKRRAQKLEGPATCRSAGSTTSPSMTTPPRRRTCR